tara:strand:- start:1473 stop:1952 length:480 start_codon:yes stop_codon:yes gene_type:complete
MELQDIFNKAHKHFASMEEPSMNTDGQCAYRGNNNNMCIVGAFIPDSLYKQSLEGDSLDNMKDKIVGTFKEGESFHNTRITEVLALAFRQKKLTNNQYLLLANLQNTHDTYANDFNDGYRHDTDKLSWYEFIKPEIVECAIAFDLEILPDSRIVYEDVG